MDRSQVWHTHNKDRLCNQWNGYAHDELGDYVCPGWPHELPPELFDKSDSRSDN